MAQSIPSMPIPPNPPTLSIYLDIGHFVLEQLQISHSGDRRFRQKPHGGALKKCANAIVDSAIHNLTKNILFSNINITKTVLKISLTYAVTQLYHLLKLMLTKIFLVMVFRERSLKDLFVNCLSVRIYSRRAGYLLLNFKP